MADIGKRNYQNGKIYCIRNYVDDDIYIGSSCQPLSKRMAWHRDARTAKKKQHLKIYKKMNELGVKQFYIELIENYPCETVELLHRREGEVIRELKPALNMTIAGRTLDEWREDCKDKLKEQSKQYYNDNKNIKKQYQQDNQEKIKERTKSRKV